MHASLQNWAFLFLSLEGRIDAARWRLGLATLCLASLLARRGVTLLAGSGSFADEFFGFAGFIALLYPFTALCAKRFRDRGRSGDLAFAVTGPSALHAMLNAGGLLAPGSAIGSLLGLAVVIGCIWFLLELGFGASLLRPAVQHHG